MAGGMHRPGGGGTGAGTGAPEDFEGDDDSATQASQEVLSPSRLPRGTPPPPPHRDAEESEESASSEHAPLTLEQTGGTRPLRAKGAAAPKKPAAPPSVSLAQAPKPAPASARAAAAPPKPPPPPPADDLSGAQSRLPQATPEADLTGAQAPVRPIGVEAELTGGHAPLVPSARASLPLPSDAPSSPLSGPPQPGGFAPALALPLPLSGSRVLYRTGLDAPDRSPARAPVLWAVGLHVALFVSVLVLPKLFGGPAPLRKPIIARLVAQGKPRDQKLMPRKEEAPPPPPSSSRSSPQSKPELAPPAKSTPKAAPVAAAPKPRAPSREELMQRALAGVSASPDRERAKTPPEEREGEAAGSPDGTAATAEEGDLYFAKVQAEILSHYSIPSIISERERMALKAVVVAWIAPDGKLLRYQFERRSGNAQFDSALERAIKASRIPAPPPERARAIRDEGVALEFTP